MTSTASGISISIAEIGIPCRHHFILVFLYNHPNPSLFNTVETAKILETNRIAPKFSDICVPLRMDVARLVKINDIEEKPIWSRS
jgi:hypothetical protein